MEMCHFFNYYEMIPMKQKNTVYDKTPYAVFIFVLPSSISISMEFRSRSGVHLLITN